MLGNSLLLIVALASAVLLFRRSETLAQAPQSQLQVSSLSLLFVAMSAMGQLLLTPDSQDVATLQRLLDNLAVYAGLPLLATATLALAMNWYWSKAGWGRWLLALFALFELCRRMGLGEDYTLWLSLALAAALLVSAWRLQPILSRLACAVAAPLLLISLSASTLMVAELPAVARQLAQASGLLLLSWALLQQTSRQTAAQ
ncbi:hypothetical protein [Marinobacterium sediminicola]|uniref:Uncharacterized protein n=1 Tax=Marinobacterium sediminicola TaxID=518898 RepID=A0ABY1S3R4_9GAMM|nr:hypothetical protein [Marinobacterium sediminicola]ULG68887.1 hypothetical protein LN244_14525 [Marinobacterium sediminicola]SMR77911.1 hypothetical protein SAMN04487964_11941 [Marinobacterium sediminicola]